jgi:hypothetical protein
MLMKSLYLALLCWFTINHATGYENGVAYEHYQRTEPEQPLSVHIMRVDPHTIDIRLVHAMGFATDREDVLSIAERTHAYAAINGGFFRRGGRYNGCPFGILKIDGLLYSDLFFERTALAWSSQGLHTPDTRGALTKIKTGCVITLGEHTLHIDRINQPREDAEIIVYTPAFRPTTLTHGAGLEIIIDQERIREIRRDTGNAPIPPTGYVISCGPQAIPEFLDTTNETILRELPVTLTYTIEPLEQSRYSSDKELWEKAEFIVGGTPGLILDNRELTAEDMLQELASGKRACITADEVPADFHNLEQSSWLINKRHPRTAVGITADKNWMFVIVDGRNPEISVGMTLPELAHFMKERGCVAALNLGGGGDSTLVIEGVVKNNPSGASTLTYKDTRPRPVSDALCMYLKKQAL